MAGMKNRVEKKWEENRRRRDSGERSATKMPNQNTHKNNIKSRIRDTGADTSHFLRIELLSFEKYQRKI